MHFFVDFDEIHFSCMVHLTVSWQMSFPFRQDCTSTSPSYFNFSEKNGSFSSSSRKKILSPSQTGSSFTLDFSTHSRHPSLHSVISPLYASAVYKNIYSVCCLSQIKVTMPRSRHLSSVSPVSSRASRSRHSSGDSSASKWPPMPTHLSLLISCSFFTRCIIRYFPSCSI